MNKAIIIILVVANMGLWACDTKDSIVPLNDSFFVKLYAGEREGDQVGEDIIATSDGGILIAGTSENETDNTKEILLIKTDDKGNLLWTFGSSSIYSGTTTSISVAKSVIEVTDGYVVGGTKGEGDGRRSVLIKVDFDGNFSSDSVTVSTIDGGVTSYNQLSKITLGYKGILVSGETGVRAVTAGEINGFIGLHDEFDLDSIATFPGGTSYKAYLGLPGDDIITGAYEVLDTLNYKDPDFPTSTPTHFLVFGSALNPDPNQGYDFFYMDLNSDYGTNIDILSGLNPRPGNQTSAYVTRDDDEYWMIGETDETGTKMFMTGWLYSTDKWDPRNSGDIDGSTGITGKGITVQSTGNYVIVGDQIITTDEHTEVYLSRVETSLTIKPPWPKTYGADQATYSSSAVITLQDGSIIVVGTADLKPVKKILVIKTGPNGEMSF